jgi:hypothetical protein
MCGRSMGADNYSLLWTVFVSACFSMSFGSATVKVNPILSGEVVCQVKQLQQFPLVEEDWEENYFLGKTDLESAATNTKKHLTPENPPEIDDAEEENLSQRLKVEQKTLMERFKSTLKPPYLHVFMFHVSSLNVGTKIMKSEADYRVRG